MPTAVATTSPVEYIHPLLQRKAYQYTLIYDCLEGEERIKDERVKYLPMANPTDKSAENLEAYRSYITRAVFYNVAQRTLSGLVGQIFMRNPIAKVPSLLDVVIDDANGQGVPCDQLAQSTSELVLPYGRAGLYVDYPNVDSDAVSLADLQSGDVRPTINLYRPEHVRNWRHIVRGAKKLLSLVVLWETYDKEDDAFECTEGVQYRVLELINNQYRVTIYREDNLTGPATIDGVVQQFFPKDHGGNFFTEIPFKFVGVNANDPHMDAPPMYSICSLNIAHYRNSADYEESIFMHGQTTAVATGLSEAWLKNVLGGQLKFGSRGGIPLPVGAELELLQAPANTIVYEAMNQKERQMVALGAKLVQQAEVQRTATEADQENTSEGSTLSKVAKNVGAAFQWALGVCAQFVIGNTNGIEYSLNTEFDLVSLSPQERAELIAEWQAGAITFSEMRDSLKRAGVATLDDDIAKTQIDKEQAEAFAAMPNPLDPNAAAPGAPAADPKTDPKANPPAPDKAG